MSGTFRKKSIVEESDGEGEIEDERKKKQNDKHRRQDKASWKKNYTHVCN